jgi:hypothetical protein
MDMERIDEVGEVGATEIWATSTFAMCSSRSSTSTVASPSPPVRLEGHHALDVPDDS